MEHDLLAQLNGPQREAVLAVEGPVLILAGPGSGKTRVITHRIAYLVRDCGVSPRHILAVTFTNKAAKEMRARLEVLLGAARAKMLTLGTFHSICARLLRHEPDYLSRFGMNPKFTIIDTADGERVVKQVLAQVDLNALNLVFQKVPRPGDILERISKAKAYMLSAESLQEEAKTDLERLVAHVMPLYEKALRLTNCFDFDDLLLFGLGALRDQPERLRYYQNFWSHVHVDEFQDCNTPQWELVRLLATGSTKAPGGPGRLCVVADDDQLIYSWRGASPQTLVKFEETFPQRTLILLEQNYRSSKTIVEAAQWVVRGNRGRKEKSLWTENERGELVTVGMFEDDREEAWTVAQEIKLLKERGVLASWKDAVVLYRVNAQSRSIEESLRRFQIPYVVVGSRSFYDRKEIKDVLAYLRLLYNQHDNTAFLRIVNEPSRKIGDSTLRKLQVWVSEQQWSLYEATKHIQDCPGLRIEAKRALRQFGELIADLLRDAERLPLPDLFDAVLLKTGYQEELERPQEGDIDRKGNVEELRRAALEYAEESPEAALEAFLEHTALLGGTENEQTGVNGKLALEDQEAVRCMSIHAVKGLEYCCVFIIGMTEGSLPHSRAWTEEEIAEECRLAYVAATRAMKRLYMFGAARRYVGGEWRESMSSRFLDDLPAHLVRAKGAKNNASILPPWSTR